MSENPPSGGDGEADDPPPYGAPPPYGPPSPPQYPYGQQQPPYGPQSGQQPPYGQQSGQQPPYGQQSGQQPPYGQPAYGAYGQYGSAAAGPPPDNHLVWAILTTLFCCLPLGIVSIVFAAQVNSKWQTGDAAGAQESSRKARLWAIWSAVAGVGVTVAFVLLAVVGGLVSSSGSS